jgi:hypothetical protein
MEDDTLISRICICLQGPLEPSLKTDNKINYHTQ